MMTYSEVTAYIREREKAGGKPGTERMRELLSRLGNPEQKTDAIHIAGTNGKGSIMAYLEQCFLEQGISCGRYISPTIFEYRDRWLLNHRPVSEEKISGIMTEVLEAAEKMADQPSAFELETAAAFLLFAREDCGVSLIECGMGGALDATNVLDHTVVDIIASISRDHMQFLGDTIPEITEQKLGIVRPGGNLVAYPSGPEAMQVMETDAQKRGIHLIVPDAGDIRITENTLAHISFTYHGKTWSIPTGCDYQTKNAVTALEAIGVWNEVMEKKGKTGKIISDKNIQKGLAETRWPGRFSVVSEDPVFIVDGAHNADAWEKLSENLHAYFPGQKLIFILGVLRDKEYEKMISILKWDIGRAFTVTPDSPRALGAQRLAKMLRENGVDAQGCGTVKEAVEEALSAAEESGKPAVSCGSLSFAGDVMKYVEAEQKRKG